MIVFNIVFTLFIPVLMVLCGYLMYKHTPKDINGLVGYRTAMSMKNQETWDFAHNYCGRSGKGRSGHDDNFGIGLCSIFLYEQRQGDCDNVHS